MNSGVYKDCSSWPSWHCSYRGGRCYSHVLLLQCNNGVIEKWTAIYIHVPVLQPYCKLSKQCCLLWPLWGILSGYKRNLRSLGNENSWHCLYIIYHVTNNIYFTICILMHRGWQLMGGLISLGQVVLAKVIVNICPNYPREWLLSSCSYNGNTTIP